MKEIEFRAWNKKEKKMTRKPKYLQKLDDNDVMINEAEHIEPLDLENSYELGEVEYE